MQKKKKTKEPLTIFDKTTIYKRECAPILKELLNKCAIHDIPFFFSACVKNNSRGSVYIADGVMTGSKDIHLYDDRIKRHMLIQGGLDVKKKERDIEVPSEYLDMIDEVL